MPSILNQIDQINYQIDSDIYKYAASLMYVVGEDIDTIDPLSIRSIAIDNDYKDTNMPMVFLTLSLDKNLIDKMVKNQDTGLFIFNLSKAVANSDMPDLYTEYISDKFVYFISEDINKSSELDYNEGTEDREDIYKVISIGLLSLDCINKNKKVVNGVITGNLSSILYYLIGDLPVLIEPPTDDVQIENQFLPPMNSISKTLSYLNSLNVFYPTPYRFFIDFDCAYLISSSGKYIKKKGDTISTILFVLHDSSYFNNAEFQGGAKFNEEQNLYKIDCDGRYCELSDNHVSDKSFTKISATDTSGKKTNAELSNKSDSSSIVNKTLSVRIPNNNTGILDNMVSSIDGSAIQLLIQVGDLDSSILTINKEYYVQAEDLYKSKEYDGAYILKRKRELYIRTNNEDLSLNTMVLLEKVPESKEEME